METKFVPLERRIKTIKINRDKIFKNRTVHPFCPQKNKEILEDLKIESIWRETKKIEIKLVTTWHNNEQQEDAKNNAEI